MLSRKAKSDSHGEDSSYFLGWQEYENNPYHRIHNPSGIIQMGLAENQLSFELLESWLASNSDAIMMKRNGESLFRELALFQDYNGMPTFKNELVDLMAKIRGNKVKFDPNNLVLTAGATSANEILMFCIADPGEALILPTPYYPGFDRDLKWRPGVDIVPIPCLSSNGFRITASALEEAYQQALTLNRVVKGVLITNPSNPLGRTMTKSELNNLITFAVAKGIHIISDEIYSGTVFDSPSFISIIEAVIGRNLQDSDLWSRIHIVYSLSKDLGLPGFRVGMIYSNNQSILATATKMSSFGLVSSQTQFLLRNILSDKKFTDKYIKENQKRLKERKELLVSGLKSVGIRCLRSNSGLFCWVDMRNLLVSNTFEAETELWKKIIFECGLNVSPGYSCHCTEPGWFRICFANMIEETLHVAIRRVKGFVDQSINVVSSGSNDLSRCWRSQQRTTSFAGNWISRLSSDDHEKDR